MQVRKKKFQLGTVEAYGHKRAPVSVSVKLSWDEEENKRVYSAMGYIGNESYGSCGQILEEIAGYRKDSELFMKLYTFWQAWHLNDLHAGTPRQEAALDEYRKESGVHNDYKKDCEYLSSIGLYEDEGHRYGTNWLYRHIPDDVWADMKGLIEEAA